MKQKDLAEEYLDSKIKQEPFKSLTKGFEYAFSAEDIKEAFNAGRESVVENMPGLVWNCFCEGLKEFYASCPIGWCYKVSYKVNEFVLFCNDCFLGRFLSFEEAKQAANEHYKKQ
ncbi:MAG: hypothetical protein HG466_000785 [Prevotella sp.]|nr:hypothetical protein [Prevotella sp.]